MDRQQRIDQIAGCYITIPTMFRDPDLQLNLDATRQVVQFLIDGGFRTGNGVILAGGAAGDFSTMTFDERVAVGEAVVAQADGRIPVVMGAQTTSTRELVRLAQAAQRIGAQYIQVSCPFYFDHTEDDFFEFVEAANDAADVGIILYNTFWTATGLSLGIAQRMAQLEHVAAIKWATPRTDRMEFERVINTFKDRLSVIDNQVQFAQSHMMGARCFECHVVNYWPAWGLQLIDLLEAGRYTEAQAQIVRVAVPFYVLWTDIEDTFTSGDGYLDKLCMELIGLPSSRCRPPTRDVRDKFREQVRQMMIDTGVPGMV